MYRCIWSFALFCILATPIDTIPPFVRGCPDDIRITASAGVNSALVVWTEPTATDSSGNTPTVRRTHAPNSDFPVGTTIVTYIFTDGSDNTARCTFDVTVLRKIYNVLLMIVM